MKFPEINRETLIIIAICLVALVLLIFVLKPKSEEAKQEDKTNAAREKVDTAIAEAQAKTAKQANDFVEFITDTPALNSDYFKTAINTPENLGNIQFSKIETEIAEKLHKELTAWINTNESEVVNAISRIKALPYLSLVAYVYQTKFGRNLRSDLLLHRFNVKEASTMYKHLISLKP